MKTLMTAKHAHGPAENGHDGCHARVSYGGVCPGVQMAEWLNGLGEDDAPYGSGNVRNQRTGALLTNGDVRQSYLDGHNHVVAVNPELARLSAEERRLSAELRVTRRRLAAVKRTAGVGA